LLKIGIMGIMIPELQPHLLSSENEKIKKNIINEISRFGLTPTQSKIYLFLSKSGPKTAAQLTKILNLPRTETYQHLTQLQNKGIVIAHFKKPTEFVAVSMEKALEIIVGNERNRIDELVGSSDVLVNLWNILPESVPTQEILLGNRFQILQGKNSILGKIKELIQTAEKEILILGSQNDFINFYHTDFFEKLRKTKANLKILTPYCNKTKYIFDHIPSEKIKKFNELVEGDLFFIVKDSQEIIFFMMTVQDNDNINALWTESKTLINSLKLLFNLVWLKSNHLDGSDDLKTETRCSLDHLIKELEQEKMIVKSLKKHVSKTKTNSKR